MQSPYEYTSKVYNYLIFSGLCGQFLGASLSARNNMKEADSKGQLFFIYLPARSLSDSL